MRGGRVVVSARAQQASAAASRGRQAETALFDWGYSSLTGGGGNASQFAIANPVMDGMLQGFVNVEDQGTLRKIYKDIYDNDPICGGTIDLMSRLPFSDFTLTGTDSKYAEKYLEAIDRLKIRSLFPEITAEFLTYAQFCGTLLYQRSSKIFTDLMPHDPDFMQVQELPFYSTDPIITVRNDKRVKDFMKSEDPAVSEFRKQLSPKLLEAMSQDTYVLDPLTAVYLERRSLMKRGPISLLRRVLPIYFLEKQLFRGTLIESAKRLRGIGHLKIGNDKWVPGLDELQEHMEWFMQADQDPLGAIVATREGVEFDEIRTAGEFWKVTDIAEEAASMKFRAMGTSEAFISGDASYDNAQVALSVFMDNNLAYREWLTNKTLGTKIFPIIAITNGFVKAKKSETASDLHHRVLHEIQNLSNFEIPSVRWHKQLTADPNNTMLDTLDKMHELGVPPTLRAICAAGGTTMEALLSEIKDEAPIIKRLADMGYDMTKFMPNAGTEDDGGGGGGDDGGGDNMQGMDDGPPPGSDAGPDGGGGGAPPANIPPTDRDQSSVRAVYSAFGKVPFLSRDWSSVAAEPYRLTKTGKKQHIINGNIHNKRVNGMLAKAAAEVAADPELRHKLVQKGRETRIAGLPRPIPE